MARPLTLCEIDAISDELVFDPATVETVTAFRALLSGRVIDFREGARALRDRRAGLDF